MVRHDRRDRDRERADAGAEQQVVEAVAEPGHEHERAGRGGGVDDLPGHVVRGRRSAAKPARTVSRVMRVVEQVEADPHEEADGVDVLELRALDDVGAHVHQVAAHRVHEAGPVRTRQRQDAGRHRTQARRGVRRAAGRGVAPRRGVRERSDRRSTIDSIVGRGPGPSSARSSSAASSAIRIAARCSGEVPQQPPTMRAPASTARPHVARHQLGRARVVDLGAAELGDAAVALRHERGLGVVLGHGEERHEDVGRADAAVGAGRDAAASSRPANTCVRSPGSMPIIVRPAVSNEHVATYGMPTAMAALRGGAHLLGRRHRLDPRDVGAAGDQRLDLLARTSRARRPR